jgi:hypothetical protein
MDLLETSNKTLPVKKRRNPPSLCTQVNYRKCHKKSNKKCRWVYGSINRVPTGVLKQHCRTRKNKKRNSY